MDGTENEKHTIIILTAYFFFFKQHPKLPGERSITLWWEVLVKKQNETKHQNSNDE